MWWCYFLWICTHSKTAGLCVRGYVGHWPPSLGCCVGHWLPSLGLLERRLSGLNPYSSRNLIFLTQNVWFSCLIVDWIFIPKVRFSLYASFCLKFYCVIMNTRPCLKKLFPQYVTCYFHLKNFFFHVIFGVVFSFASPGWLWASTPSPQPSGCWGDRCELPHLTFPCHFDFCLLCFLSCLAMNPGPHPCSVHSLAQNCTLALIYFKTT